MAAGVRKKTAKAPARAPARAGRGPRGGRDGGGARGRASSPAEGLALHGELWLGAEGRPRLGGVRLRLLEGIAATGSLAQAAEAAGVSYRTAWSLVGALNALSRAPLVESAAGGPHGGGTRLTAHGAELLALVRGLQAEHARYLARLAGRAAGSGGFPGLAAAARRLSLATSARNQLHGTVASVRARGLSAEVTLRLGPPGHRSARLTARITREGLESLGLRRGDPAYALVKANWVGVEAPGTAGAGRGANRLAARVESRREEGGVVERVLRLAGGPTLVSSLPNPRPSAGRALRGAAGGPGAAAENRVIAVIDPSHVILGVAG